MKNQLNALLLTVALSGLVGGTSVAAQTATHGTAKVNAAKAGLRYVHDTPPASYSLKGKNGCKGTGGPVDGRSGLQGQEHLQGQRRMRHRRLQAAGIRISPNPTGGAAGLLQSGYGRAIISPSLPIARIGIADD